MTNYPIGDFLIKIKNAAMSGNREVEVVATNFIVSVANVLKKLGYLEEVKKKDNILRVVLAFHKKEPVLINLKLVSRPGLRTYINFDELSKRKGASFLIISSPKGVMSSKEALKSAVGGEVIAEVW